MNVMQKIRNYDYEIKLDYPHPPKRVCSCGHSFSRESAFCGKCGASLAWYQDALRVCSDGRLEYQKEENRLVEAFKNDCFIQLGIEGHKKADDAFRIAWERQHSYGLDSVFADLEELSVLLID